MRIKRRLTTHPLFHDFNLAKSYPTALRQATMNTTKEPQQQEVEKPQEPQKPQEPPKPQEPQKPQD